MRQDAAPHLQLCQLLLQLPRNDLRVPRSESMLVVCRVGWVDLRDMCERKLRDSWGSYGRSAGWLNNTHTTPLLPPVSPGPL